MRRFSLFTLLREGLRHQRGWTPFWRTPEPRSHYDVVIIGAGGHGLATAYYLARNHGVRNVAVLEKGWLGGGNTGRNTTVVRSNYFHPESIALYDFSLQLYEGLARDINYNVMLSQRGHLTLAHSRHEMELFARWVNALQANGIDAQLLSRAAVLDFVPLLNRDRHARFPVLGAFIQPRGGVARHDAVAWGYARAADALGVDIIQQCEVSRFDIQGGRVRGVLTSKGHIGADVVAIVVAGHSSVLAARAGVQLPIDSRALQAFVSEPIKPVLDTAVLSNSVNCYVSQTDKGEIVVGGSADLYPSYAQRGAFPTIEKVTASMIEMFPSFGRLRLLRQWAGIVDITPDRSPIIDRLPVDGLFINAGWGTGGFKAIPAGGWTFAHLLATGKSHELAAPFSLGRFATGACIDEGAAAGVAH